jgi:hypothetical protein
MYSSVSRCVDVDGNTDTMPTFLLGVGDGECEPSRENCLLVVFDGDAVVAEDDRLFGVLSWVLVRPDFARLLFGGGVEVRVVIVNGILERAVLMFDELGFPLGERVECDPTRTVVVTFRRITIVQSVLRFTPR